VYRLKIFHKHILTDIPANQIKLTQATPTATAHLAIL